MCRLSSSKEGGDVYGHQGLDRTHLLDRKLRPLAHRPLQRKEIAERRPAPKSFSQFQSTNEEGVDVPPSTTCL